MAKSKLTATQKLRANVRRQITRMEKRGYFIPTEIKEKVKSAKYQTLKSFQRNRYSKLYSVSTGLSDRGKIVSGTEYRQQERSESARKSARTRRERQSIRNREFQSQDYYDDYENEQWERERRRQDEIDRSNARLYQEGEIAYNEIQSLINQYPGKGASSLERALTNEIRKYGKENVLIAIGQSPQEVIEHARTILYYEDGADAIHGAFLDFFNVITGTIPSDTEAKELGDTLDAMTDFESR